MYNFRHLRDSTCRGSSGSRNVCLGWRPHRSKVINREYSRKTTDQETHFLWRFHFWWRYAIQEYVDKFLSTKFLSNKIVELKLLKCIDQQKKKKVRKTSSKASEPKTKISAFSRTGLLFISVRKAILGWNKKGLF